MDDEKMIEDATATIGSVGIVLTYDDHEVVIPWSKVEIKREDIAKAIE